MDYMIGYGAIRDIDTGVDPVWDEPTEADGALDEGSIPDEPIATRLEGPWGYPYFEGLEDPYTLVGDIPLTADPLPWSPSEGTSEVGNLPRVGAYEGAFRTIGPVTAWGHEVSGGLDGDQALGRIMRFPANIPERYDPYGVFDTDYRDDVALALDLDNLPYYDDASVTSSLLNWPYTGDW